MPPRARRWPGDEPGHTFKTEDLAGLPAALYLRVSSNRDETEQKSTGEQQAEGLGWKDRAGVVIKAEDIYKDDDRSASTFAHTQRKNFEELRKAIAAGQYKIVWFWATSRQTRGDVPLDVLADESAKHGVLWCVNGQILNPASGDDHLFLTIHYIMDRQYSYRISKDAKRGLKAVAHQGKPGGRVAYGYHRVHEVIKGKKKWVRDEANVFDGNGQAIENSPAYVVREIYDRIAGGEPIGKIARSLEDRRIPTPQKPRREGRSPFMWTHHSVLFIARNPVYIRGRIYQSESWRVKDRHAAILPDVKGQWPELVSEEQWYTVQRILSDPSRQGWRPGARSRTGGRAGHLLAGVARCGECGNTLHVHSDHARGIVPYYVCHHRGHVGIREDWLDTYVEDRIVSWLADPQVHTYLWGQRKDDTAVAAAARAEVAQLLHKIEEARIKGEDPDEDGVFWGRRSVALAGKLTEARKLAQPVSLSPVLAGMVGPDAADKWWALRRDNLPGAKQLIKAVADIRVHKGVHGGDRRHAVIDPGRISWAWLTGPGDHSREFGKPIVRATGRAAEALRAAPEDADRVIAQKLGISHRTVYGARSELEAAGEIPVVRRKGRGKPVNHGYQPGAAT
jgi:DNA invertase Pin-like site-specific DNA recombinase